MRRTVFFDFDGTLTRTDTVLPFLRHYHGGGWRFYLRLLPLLPLLAAYLAGWVSNLRAKEAVCRRFLAGERESDVLAAAAVFAETVLPRLLREQGMAKLQAHLARGDVCVLVSASPEWYLLPWARQHGFAAVFGTRMAQVSGCLNGRVDGENCYGAAKVRRIEAALGADCWQSSTAYSDSLADTPLLSRAETGWLWRRGRFVRFQAA